MRFDWHGGEIDRSTRVDATYKNTQNVRRFLSRECGPQFKFDRDFMDWIANDEPKNMGIVVDEWLRRYSGLKDR
jgi:hypothetical protein